MNQARIRALICASLAAAALSGCTASQDGVAATAEAAPMVTRAATPTRLVDRDVEAPEVFQVADQALWDGRPSLGGVWVASPDAVDPERVILRNPSNGKFVIGALFRRERLNPGPALQISSDAAAALGILAGQPTNLDVTALRRDEAQDDAAPALAATPEVAKPILDTAETVETTTLAAAAIDRAEETAPEPAVQPAAAATAPAVATPAVATPAVVADGAAGTAAASDVAAETIAALAPAAPEKKLPFWKRKPKAAQTDDTIAAAATAEAMPLALPTATAIPVVATGAAAPAPKAGRAIQIGIFSVEANAGRAVDALAKAGVPSRVVTEASHGKTFWRVIADPAADSAATLAKVKSAGFADAYFVKG